MNPLQRFFLWLTSKPPEPVSPFKQHMLRARQAQYAERYAEAMEALAAALEVANAEKKVAAQVDIILSQADILYYQQRYDEAQALLEALRVRTEEASQRAPLAYTLCSLGVLAQARGDAAEARRLFERARSMAQIVRANGAEARTAAHLADVYLTEGNATYAVHLFREALPQLVKSGDTELEPFFMIRLGQALIQIGSTTEANGVLRAALDKTTSLQQRRYQRMAHLVMGSQAISATQYDQAQAHYESALALYPEEAATTPDYIQALCQLSLALLRQQQPATALDRAQFALQCALALQDAQWIARAQAHLGMAQRASGDPAALDTLKTALAFYAGRPEDAALYLALLRDYAQALADGGSAAAALATLEEVRQWAERDGSPATIAQADVEIGRLHERERRLKEALAHYTEALRHYDLVSEYAASVPLQCRIASVREQQGQGKRAIKDLEQALERLSYVADAAIRREVMLSAALIYSDYGELDTAENFFKQALELAQQGPDRRAEALCRLHYGRFLVLVQDIKPAITILMEAGVLAQSSGMPLVLALHADGLALAFAHLGDTARALDYHDEASAALPPGEDIWAAYLMLHRANTLRQMDTPEQARSLYEAALAEGRRWQHPHLIIEALVGLALVALHHRQSAQDYLAEAQMLVEKSYSRRLLAKVRSAQSQQQAASGDLAAAQATWQEATKLLRILRLPAPDPAWLAQSS